jgi:hypothetical protein
MPTLNNSLVFFDHFKNLIHLYSVFLVQRPLLGGSDRTYEVEKNSTRISLGGSLVV